MAFLISSVKEIVKKNAPIANDKVHAMTKNSYKTNTYCNVTAIKYPIGFFESNGNLQFEFDF